ncbi:GNAT family N-acetyltransferase [Pseudalkalibacillus hwajinpoensis]|uniref:GNAT family N-acetyltransferase n=1 Tax=Guptibacillus hwajinpoensis TaxID=208199 RepID=UPI001CFEE98C|nr:GNAT family N-acetyltransferase [Pseudalkalibacillus hwajinpoensis]
MNKEQIIRAIEAIQWDYEEAFVPESIHYIQNDDLVMIKNENSTSVYANKVVRFYRSVADVKEVIAYFKGSPFSWWVRSSSNSSELESELKTLGFQHEDTYVGLAKILTEEEIPSIDFSFREVTTEEDVEAHVQVAAEIWGYDSETKQAAVYERASYLKCLDRRGGYTLVLDNNKPVGYSNYRYSKDGKAIYLSGAAVLPEYRGKGIYRSLLADRLIEARKRGCELAVTQARVGMSEPILRKSGFHEYATFKQYVRI